MAPPPHPHLAGITDHELATAYSAEGNYALAKRLGVSPKTLDKRIRRLRAKGMSVPTTHRSNSEDFAVIIKEQGGIRQHPQRFQFNVNTGVVLVFSDAHYWPGNPSVAHRALVKMVHEMAPAAVICNGDAVDMAAVSRHPPIGWEARPGVQQEIETAQARLGEILQACTKKTVKTWNLGNHDARFETRLASVAPEYAKVAGIHLHDHFPEWERAWATWINDDVVVKHRFKGGDHATWNNTIKSGKTMVTGHLHSARVNPFTDYNGTRFGVDTGCLADTYGKQFVNYTEDNPRNWVSAFGVLTFHKGKLLWPELVTAWDDNTVQFRGQLITV